MNRLALLGLVAGAACVAASCSEDLDGGQTCPVLCPEQSLPVRDTVLDAIAFDTTVGTFPLVGTEPGLLLASHGDTLDVRAVVRYDSLSTTYVVGGVTHDIEAVDSAHVFVRIDTSVVGFIGTVTLQLFDVDTTAADADTAAIIGLFRADRLLGSVDIARTTLFLDDTLSIAIPNSFVLAKIQTGGRVRVGIRLVGTGDLTLRAAESGLPASLQFDPVPGDTTVGSRSVGPLSRTPVNDLLAAIDLRDYSLLVKVPPAPTERMTVGGLPANRAYLRFAIPSFFFDSVVVVRAQLAIEQRPVRGFADSTVVTVFPVPVSTGAAVTDVRRAAQLAYPPFSFGVAALTFAPRDSGGRRIDMVGLFRAWSAGAAAKASPITALVLRSATEGQTAGRLAFFGLDAPQALRPRLVISYVARTRFGIP